jgi:hypothetical protein
MQMLAQHVLEPTLFVVNGARAVQYRTRRLHAKAKAEIGKGIHHSRFSS